MTRNIKTFGNESVSAIKRFDTRLSSSFSKLSNLSQLALGLGVGGIFMMAIQNNIAYEDSLASVSAVTGATGKELGLLETQAMKTAKSQKMLGADVFKAYELIASAKPELLTNTRLLDEVTNSAVTLSKAARMELGPAADSLTTSLNQFGLGGEYARKVVDNLAAGTVYGASSIIQTSDALSKFGTIAAATGTKIDESIALIQLVSPFEKGAEAGTKLRNILTNMASAKILPKDALIVLKKYGVNTDILTSKTIPLNEKLKEMSKISKDTTAMVQVFGKENVGLAQGLLSNADKFGEMLTNVNKSGAAMDMAKKNTNTFRFALDSIKTSFLNTTTATQSGNSTLDMFKKILFGVGNNMDTVVTIALGLVAAFILMKAIIIGTSVVTAAYNIALGLNTAVMQTNKKALIGNTLATNVYKIAMGIGTAVTWLANSAFITLAVSILAATWPILALVAAVLAVIYIFLYWDEICKWFGRQWETLTNNIQTLWLEFIGAFTEFSWKDFFIGIGQAIIEYMLFPLKAVLKLATYLPGKVGALAQKGLDELNKMTDLSAIFKTPEDTKKSKDKGSENYMAGVLPSTGQSSSESVQKSVWQNNVAIDIKDKGGNVGGVKQTGSKGGIPVKVSNTVGAF